MPYKSLGKRIVNLRESHGIKQAELARKLNINKSSMSKIESGDRKVSSDEISKIADIFNISTDYLLGRDVKPHVDTLFDEYIDIPLDGLSKQQRQNILDFVKFQKYQYKKQYIKKNPEKVNPLD